MKKALQIAWFPYHKPIIDLILFRHPTAILNFLCYAMLRKKSEQKHKREKKKIML
jgi:hypothetical protein